MLHTLSSCIRAFFISVAIYFLLFFFAPNVSGNYLGTSFKSMRNVGEQQLVQLLSERRESLSCQPEEVGDKVAEIMEEAGSYTTSQIAKARELLSRPEFAQKVQKAAEKGGVSLLQVARSLLGALQ